MQYARQSSAKSFNYLRDYVAGGKYSQPPTQLEKIKWPHIVDYGQAKLYLTRLYRTEHTPQECGPSEGRHR